MARGVALGPLSGKYILIVEDAYLVAEDLASVVKELGGEVIGPAPTQAHALWLLNETRPDGVLLDIALSGGTSIMVAERLCGLGIPYIVTSGFTREHLPPVVRDAPYLPKPFGSQALVDAMITTFASRRRASPF